MDPSTKSHTDIHFELYYGGFWKSSDADAMDPSTLCGDNSFGPAVKSVDCRGGFDFTGTYEFRRGELGD